MPHHHRNPEPHRRRPAPRQRGAVMVITLLGIFLLAGLVMYVMNLGRQVNGRVVTQHAADATGAAGAGWAARSLNTVAMNNVANARLIPLVAVLDGMPRASAETLADQEALLEAIDGELRRGVPDNWVRDALASARPDVASEVAELRPIDALFNGAGGIDVRELTFYEGPAGRGQLWQAMAALDEYSQATMASLGPLAQLAASSGGRANLEEAEAAAVLLPVEPAIPWQRGSFDDFERPVRRGRLPEAADDPITNRGPFDAVFGWRHPVGGETEGYWRDSDIAGGGTGSVPIGRGAQPGEYVVTSRDPDAYGTRGTFWWLVNRVSGFNRSSLPYSRLARRASTLARAKLHRLWPTDPAPPQEALGPDWRTDFPEATRIADDEPERIEETAFIAVEIKSRYPRRSPRFMSPGSWAYVDTPPGTEVRVVRVGGWQDPRTWAVPKIADHMWRDEWTYAVFFDNEIGIARQSGPAGNPLPQPVYRIDTYAFAGVNVGERSEIRDPYNVGRRDELPAPIDLDHEAIGAGRTAAHDERLRFLGIAEKPHRPLLWPSRFSGGAGHPRSVGLAATRVFNDHSWDLWTQMWHARLEPIGDYERWLATMRAGAPVAATLPDLSADRYDELLTYLESLDELAPETIRH